MNITRLMICVLLAPWILASCSSLVGTLEVGIENSGAPSQTLISDIETPAASPEPISTPTSVEINAGDQTGTVNGRICYPGEMIPAMTAFFQNMNSGEVTSLPIDENQSTYSVELIPGQYIAFAYLRSGAELGGSYSNAVPCGLSVDCTDHAPLPFDLMPGETISDIDLCDWYAPDAVPANPNARLAPLAGMVYSMPEGDVYWIQPSGDSKSLFGPPGMAIPWVGPDGVYFENNDLQAVDLFTGEQFNLTNTPDMVETSYQFEVGLPEQLLFTARHVTDDTAPGMTGGLYIINMDGSDLRAVDSLHNVGKFAAAPDGQTIAWGMGPTGFLYKWETGMEPFDPLQYGMNSPTGQNVASPSWSPLGDKLAWFVMGFFDGQETSGYAIFDLNAQTYTVVHPFQMPATDGYPPAALWSPDGEWLAVSAFHSDPARNGVWLVNTHDPQQEIFMGTSSSNPVFGPWTAEQKLVAYTRFDEAEGASQVWIYDLVSGEHRQTELPANAQVMKWW